MRKASDFPLPVFVHRIQLFGESAGRAHGGDHCARQGARGHGGLCELPHRRSLPGRLPAASASIPRMAVIYSPNLTPDRETGIGAWSDDDFRRASVTA